jgi:hypothetical protein
MAVKNEELVFKKIIEERFRLCKHKDYVFPREFIEEEEIIGDIGHDMLSKGFRLMIKKKLKIY